MQQILFSNWQFIEEPTKKVCQPFKEKELSNCQFEKELTLKTFQNMRENGTSDLFYECVSVRASKHEIILNSALPMQQKHLNYKSHDN